MKSNSKILLTGAILIAIVVLIGFFVGWPAAGLAFFGALILFVVALKLFGKSSGYSKSIASDSSLSLVNVQSVKNLMKQVKKTNPKCFKKEMRELENQVLRMEKKSTSLDDSLREYFGTSRISYEKFASTLNGAVGVFDDQVKKTLSRINIFDVDGYEQLFKNHLEYTDAIKPYEKTFDEIHDDLKRNEEILKRVEKLQMEVSHLNTASDVSLDTIPAMEELSDLTRQTKLYQQNSSRGGH